MKEFCECWMPVLLWAGLIFVFSSISGEGVPDLGFIINLLHLFEYLVLALLLSRAVRNSKLSRLSSPRRFFFVILVCLIYAVSDEFHQQFVSGRSSSSADLLLDTIGILLGAAIYPW